MGKMYDGIDGALQAFIEAAADVLRRDRATRGDWTRELVAKGTRRRARVGPRVIVYLDHVGSGAETIATSARTVDSSSCCAHSRDRRRSCACTGAARSWSRTARVQRAASAFSSRAGRPCHCPLDRPANSDSCGFGVPEYTFVADRSQLRAWAERKGTDGLERYQQEKNAFSIDGLPALHGPAGRAGTSR